GGFLGVFRGLPLNLRGVLGGAQTGTPRQTNQLKTETTIDERTRYLIFESILNLIPTTDF
ncbi:MAG: hypothetical protein NTW61_01440, partial [Candidatus Melainabacteria bacterium]|nr:hypothetical protein [Candidatus Melainabacteria bacterium]